MLFVNCDQALPGVLIQLSEFPVHRLAAHVRSVRTPLQLSINPDPVRFTDSSAAGGSFLVPMVIGAVLSFFHLKVTLRTIHQTLDSQHERAKDLFSSISTSYGFSSLET